MTRPFLFGSAILASLLLATATLRSADEPTSTGAAKGANLPGPFQAWTLNGSHPGKYHCPVCERGLLPGVLVISRSVPDKDDKLADLLAGLEKLAADRKDARFGAAVIFPVLKDEIQLDEERGPILAQLDELVKAGNLTSVAVGVTRKTADEVAAYGLVNDDSQVVVLLFDRLKVKERFESANPLTAEQVADLLKKTDAMLPPPPPGKKRPVIIDK